MMNLTTNISKLDLQNEQIILTKEDGTSFNLDELGLMELGNLIGEVESKEHRQTILDVYNKKLAEIADVYLKSQGIGL